MAGTMLEHDWFPVPLPDRVEVGTGSWLYSSYAFLHATTREDVVIGRHSGVYNGTFFDLGPGGSVMIGDYCTVVGAIFSTSGHIAVHDYAFIAHEVVIADDHHPVPPAPSTEAPAAGGGTSIVIGENSWIGARAILLGGATIGRDAIVGAGAVVDGAVPDRAIVAGNPYRIVGSVQAAT